MFKLIIQCIFLIVYIINIDCEVYQDRPKIITANGDLILEPAFDRNIYLRPNGPRSSILVGEKNILELKINNQNVNEATTNNLEELINGHNGIIKRLETLESNRVSPLNNDVFLNISMLWRKVGILQRNVRSLYFQLYDHKKDVCQLHPCKHGGTCLSLVDGYHCLCPNNWEGQDCDEDVNECRNFAGTDLGCQNGATCINKPGTYECLCKPKWFGIHCTRKEKDCSGGDFEMCGHGKCVSVSTGDGITCICDQGWTTNGTGYSCLTDINECETQYGPHCSVNPRVECINLPGSFRCGQCPIGYEGDGYVCSDINECIVTPNGGCNPMVSCYNTIGSRVCGSCPPGYIGDGVSCTWRGSCNINHGGCHPSAQCVENMTSGQVSHCICPDGMEGDGKGLMGCYVSNRDNLTRSCNDNPCGIHGQCHVVRNGYTCVCRRGYSGLNCEVSTNPCAVNPCYNNGICRLDDSTSRGFRCECTSQYSGPLCQFVSRTCGGMLDNEEGSIVYPMSNTTYSHNSRCAWVIHTIPGKVINVTFTKFNLEESPECTYDFLQIHDGRSSVSQLIGRFCGNIYPKGGNIISSDNYLYFWFRSDGTVAKNGFALHWTSVNPLCGGEVNAITHGHISSPGSPGKYPPNRDCLWHLTTMFGKRIQLHFFALDLETHANCSFDYLAIYDGTHDTDPLLNKYCNSSQPAPIQSAGSELLIHFHSDAYGSGYGFQLAYAPIEGIPGCGGYFTADNGEIFSPSFNGTYLSNLLCEYKIKTSVDTKIRIDFKQFNLERSLKCKFDYLKIYDGESSDAPLVGKFCGSIYPKSYVASSNALYLKFRSDLTVSSDGFKITYQALCQMNLIGDSGVIKSPGYPFSYPNDKVCEYVISATPGKAITLSFQYFDIEDSRYYNCTYDYVEIRDGADANSTLLGKFCGSNTIPPTLTSTHNYMYVKFKSDISRSGTGFYANYTTVNTECGGIYRNTIGLINHPPDDAISYKNDQTCTWMLVAPEGMHIKLTWNRFEIENMPSCASDYLELIEIDRDNVFNSIGRFCGNKYPPALTISTNRLMIKFKSDSSVRSTGFSLSYTFLDEKTHCGGNYLKSHGYIYSPGWPKRYEPNRDCKWTIIVPVGQQIRINISEFDLEGPIRDTCIHGDYLEFRNGASQTAPLIGQFCGEFKSKLITTLGNTLFIYFHSDVYLTGNGFKLEWDGSILGCGGTLTAFSGALSSPNYPENYDENSECFYKIITSFGSRIRLSFIDLDLERTNDCRDDYVEIFDGRDSDAPSLGKHCYMSTELNNIISSTNNVFIKFRSDFYNERKGFLLNYFTICNNNLTGRYGIIENPGYPDDSPLHLNCVWNITVPKGNKINITFYQFHLVPNSPRRVWYYSNKDNSFCNECYLQWKESTDLTYSTKICGRVTPPMITTKSDSLQIKFSSGDSKSGFRLEWVNYGCGGHIQKDFGTVNIDLHQSSNELECEWLVETSPGTKINLIVTSLYVSNSVNCTIDAIKIYNGQNIDSPPIITFCDKQSTLIQSSANYMLIKFFKHSNLKGAHFASKFQTTRASCGGIMRTTSGYIYSKNYPKNYDDNLDCIWIISVPINHRIHLTFEDLDLYSYSEIEREKNCGDSIKIFDSSFIFNSNYTYRICGNTKITELTTKYSDIKVQFTSNGYGNAKGFKIYFKTTCGAEIIATEDGIVSNINYIPTTNESCLWTIVAPELEQKISLTITHLDLPKWNSQIHSNKSCSLSYLRIYDGNDINAPVLNEYCGNKVPPIIVSHGSFMTILLGSYTTEIIGHFSAHYSVLSTACGGTFTSEEGSIVSPNYPREYPINADCEWILSTSPGNKVAIIFEQFDLEDSDGCNEDYVEIRESRSSGTLLGVYCGSSVPINITSGQKLYVKFHSNEKNNGNGFLIHYEFLHGNEITGLESGEIASPLYPHVYQKAGEYSWRIFTDSSSTITLAIDSLEIHTYVDMCNSKLSLYDGYDETAPLIDELCGILREGQKVLHTTSNVAFIKLIMDESNTGAIFHLRWTKSDKITNLDVNSDKVNCGSNKTIEVLPGHTSILQSPNYPNTYGDYLNCEWVYKAIDGQHLRLRFQNFEIEEANHCFSDYISIYSANIPGQWSPLMENVCQWNQMSQYINSSTYMKIIFKTDYSVGRKGFQGQISSICGGLITNLSGEIALLWEDANQIFDDNKLKCEWVLKVRPGRVIKFDFIHFNITNSENQCFTDVTLRNGDSTDSPLLSSGRYCGYSHEIKSNIVTTTNALHIAFSSTRLLDKFQNFKIHYEEENIECGATSNLENDHPWEIISSTNYPLVPVPFSECIWIFTGPPGESLQIDFLDRFDLDNSPDCGTEVVEIRDGFSGLAPLKGRFCSEKPGTLKSTSNALFVRYLTQLAVPRNGFKANVSISVCGGTIRAGNGEITSPHYPHNHILPVSSVCEWHIQSTPNTMINIYPKDIDIPESETPCATKITIERTFPGNNSVGILRTFCHRSNDDRDFMSPLETFTNDVTIKFHIGKPTEWSQGVETRGFRFGFNSSRSTCGGLVEASEGYVSSPGYPLETALIFCRWYIRVPDKTRKIHLELMDFDRDQQNIVVANDASYLSKTSSVVANSSQLTRIYDSSGPKLYILLQSRTKNGHKFKAKFSSDEQALCGDFLIGLGGYIVSPDSDESYVCEWYLNIHNNIANNNNSDIYKTILVSIQLNSSLSNGRCRFHESNLKIRSIEQRGTSMLRTLCSNTQTSFRLPSRIASIKAFKSKADSFDFKIQYRANPCGGIVNVGEDPINIFNLPDFYNSTIDCAWVVVVPDGNKIQLIMEGSFTYDCDDEYINFSSGLSQYSSTFGKYCKNKTPTYPLITNFRNTYIEYHSKAQNHSNIKLIIKSTISQCGGDLSNGKRIFSSPNYPKNYNPNQECTWMITTNLGNWISLSFIDRFLIEDKPNCTKDALIIFDWINNSYNQIAKLCGRNTPISYNSTFNKMKVVFRTDESTNLEGFKAIWTLKCGGKYLATEKEQLLYSPGYPGDYGNMENCLYDITAPANQNVIVKFLEFKLEGTYPDCEFDNLTIDSSNGFNGVYCGSQVPPVILNVIRVELKFKSDQYLNNKGFLISYSIYQCGSLITQPTIITSNNDTNYDNNMNCTWVIRAPSNKIVILNFLYIDIESTDQCHADYVAVFNGAKIDDDNRLALLCGRLNSSTDLRSTNNEAIIQFVTDQSYGLTGFKVQVLFSYSEAVGCGGRIDMTSLSTKTLKSFLLDGNHLYEHNLDCLWTITSPPDTTIKIDFVLFHVSPCINVTNQTAIGYSNCDCDFVEIKDGFNLDSSVIGTYCGHTLPPSLFSSSNLMSVRFSTDGEINSSGFEATLSVHRSLCGKSNYVVNDNIQTIYSPNLPNGAIHRNLHCVYYLDTSLRTFSIIRISIKQLDLQPQSDATKKCSQDKLIISVSGLPVRNNSFGKNLVVQYNSDSFISSYISYEDILPTKLEFCGSKKPSDLYLTGSFVAVTLMTSSNAGSNFYRGVEIDFEFAGLCGRNYTGTQGKIMSHFTDYYNSDGDKNCNTLITAPENHTISLYFISMSPDYWNEDWRLTIFDGNTVNSPKLVTMTIDYENDYPVFFSTGKHMLLRQDNGVHVVYDLNFVTSDKGRGCGGKLINELGRVTSPMYPDIYRRKSTCEWELETPVGTHLKVHFAVFDLGRSCDQNYVQLVNSKGDVISTYCSEKPADYLSSDNYVKIIFHTTQNNGGTGWVADFVGITT